MSEKNTERKLLYIGRAQGFSQRTYDRVESTPYLPFECDEKWRSPVSQTLIKRDLDEFVLKSKIRPDDPMLELAVYKTYENFRLQDKVKMIHLNDVFNQDLDIWTKSPGLPWRDLGYKTKGDIKRDPEAVRKVRKFAHFIKNGVKMEFPDCLAYVRSHVCDAGEYKVRAVWGYPATITFIEAMFALPLIRGYQDRRDEFRPIAYGFETAMGGMKKLIKRFCHPDAQYTGIDFRKFDKTVPPWLINIAFDILMSNICFTHYEDYGVADARKNILLFNAIRRYFIETKIRLANGCRYKKFSGIASGSYFTQLIGSIVNSIIINWLSLLQFGSYPIDAIYLGDDSFIASLEKWDLEFCNSFMRQFGMEINLDKSEQSDSMYSIKFLGYKIGGGQPMKSREEWMAALLFPERPDTCFSDVQNRALGLYYANMCIDLEFARICKTIVSLKHFDVTFSRNFERMLKHIGLNIAEIDPYNLPDPLYFLKYM